LLPGSPGCMCVVTSRGQLAGIVVTEGAHALRLDLFSAADAEQLLASRVGSDRLAAEPAAAGKLVAACARLPLALCAVASRAALQPRLSLTALVRDLSHARDEQVHGGLDAFGTGDSAADLRAVFSWSYRLLGPGAARLLRLLSQHPGDDIGLPAAASLAGVDGRQARLDLAELTEAGLLTEHLPGRYALHDLLRAYAGELFHKTEAGADRTAAPRRLLDHYLHTAYAASVLTHPPFSTISLAPPQPGTTPERLADRAAAEDWFTAERTVLLAVIRHAAAAGHGTHAWQLSWAVAGHLDRRGFWQEWNAALQLALDAAARDGDRYGQAHTHRDLGRVCFRLGHHDDAYTHLARAMELFQAVDDPAGLAHTHLGLGLVLEHDARYHEALRHAEQALALFTAAGHTAGVAYTLNVVGWKYALLGEYRRTVEFCEEALHRLRAVDDRQGEADTWDSLGYAHHHLGNHQQAITCYQHALQLCEISGDRYAQTTFLDRLGHTYLATANIPAARSAWQHALTILHELDHPDAARIREQLSDIDRATAVHAPGEGDGGFATALYRGRIQNRIRRGNGPADPIGG
jgi:tetratricopeptide (TPR) repeat protein